MGIIKKINCILVAAFAGSFTIYWFNLDNKFLYYVVYPMLQKRYDKVDLTRDKRL